MQNKRTKITFIMALLGLAMTLTACGNDPQPQRQSAQASGQQQTETAFQQQSTAVPYPVSQLRDSTERRNLRERLLRFNKANRIGYLYLLSYTGTPTAYYTIEGKVSSTDSQMTTQQLIIRREGYNGYRSDSVVNAPGDDGSYGPNESGIFFFTTEGALVETNQQHLYSDQPIPTYVNVPKLNGTAKVADLSARK